MRYMLRAIFAHAHRKCAAMHHSQSRMQAALDLCRHEIFFATLHALPRILLCALRRFYIPLARRGVFVAASFR
jgi:hypothetical protein